MKKLLVLILFLFFYTNNVFAIDITVGIKPAEPFVIAYPNPSEPTGFSIDLIEMLFDRMDGDYNITYYYDTDLKSHFNTIQNGDVDLGIAATTITSVREEYMDFSYPFFESSLGIVTRNDVDKLSVFDILFSKDFLMTIFIFFAYIVICSHVIWLIERKNGSFSEKYFAGVSRGMWWTIVTMSTVGYGDVVPKKPWGKFFGSFIILSGIIIFGLIIGQLSSQFTLNELQFEINSAYDLAGKKVAVISGTQTQELIRNWGARQVPSESIADAISKLENGEVDAVVHDTPLLKYYLNTNDNDLILLDSTYFPSFYGITFEQGSSLREKINVVLIDSIEDGSYDELVDKWF